MSNMQPRQRGIFIAMEGVDGSGISTQSAVLQRWLQAEEQAKVLLTKEPSDGPVGNLARQALTGRLQGIAPETLALLFAGDRVDHIRQQINPALENGHHVICDRYLLSSLAYQGLDLDRHWIEEINSQIIRPDLTIFIRVAPATSLQRIRANRFQIDLYERESTLQKVLANYDQLLAESRKRGEQVVEIDGEQTPELVSKAIQEAVALLLEARS